MDGEHWEHFPSEIGIYYHNGRVFESHHYDGFARKFSILAKQIKAAKGKCVDIEISMEVVECE